jgi:hypothetical protein
MFSGSMLGQKDEHKEVLYKKISEFILDYLYFNLFYLKSPGVMQESDIRSLE